MWGSLSLHYQDRGLCHDWLVGQPLPADLSFLVHYGCCPVELTSSYSATLVVLFFGLLWLKDGCLCLLLF